MKNITPLIREIDWQLREIESGRLEKPEKINGLESLARKMRGHLRADYGLEAANNLKAILGQGRDAG